MKVASNRPFFNAIIGELLFTKEDWTPCMTSLWAPRSFLWSLQDLLHSVRYSTTGIATAALIWLTPTRPRTSFPSAVRRSLLWQRVMLVVLACLSSSAQKVQKQFIEMALWPMGRHMTDTFFSYRLYRYRYPEIGYRPIPLPIVTLKIYRRYR